MSNAVGRSKFFWPKCGIFFGRFIQRLVGISNKKNYSWITLCHEKKKKRKKKSPPGSYPCLARRQEAPWCPWDIAASSPTTADRRTCPWGVRGARPPAVAAACKCDWTWRAGTAPCSPAPGRAQPSWAADSPRLGTWWSCALPCRRCRTRCRP